VRCPYTPAVAPKGTFPESDPSEVADFLDQKVLKAGLLLRFIRKYDGAVIQPAVAGDLSRKERKAAEAGLAHASISKAALTGGVHVHVWPPDGMTEDDVVQRIASSSVAAPEPRKSFGQYMYDFSDASGRDLVTFAIAVLRAVGAQPVNDQWEWLATEPVGE